MNDKQVTINDTIVRRLINAQFPQWKDLLVTQVAHGGWDNRTFHLGKEMLVRMPSAERYAMNVEKEQRWLPKLAPFLPLSIPEPLALGQPGNGYPWKWSIYRWLDGETAEFGHIDDLCDFATTLAQFLTALQSIDSTNGPLPGAHNFHRGGSLTTYDFETRQAIAILKDKINVESAIEIWETALTTSWHSVPVWVHGDISVGNLLVKKGLLNAVIDFGGVAVGDPACDLAITWTLFKEESREAFRAMLPLDTETWRRGRAWTLWKTLIIASGLSATNAVEGKPCWRVINEVLADHRNGQ